MGRKKLKKKKVRTEAKTSEDLNKILHDPEARKVRMDVMKRVLSFVTSGGFVENPPDRPDGVVSFFPSNDPDEILRTAAMFVDITVLVNHLGNALIVSGVPAESVAALEDFAGTHAQQGATERFDNEVV